MSKLQTKYIADGAVTNDKLGTDAVDSAKFDETDDYTLTGTIDMTGATAVTVPTPSGDNEASPKSYVDNVAAGLKWKDSARVRAQGNIAVAAPGANIDSTAMSVDERVLLDQQSTAAEDGIYLWKGAAVPMVRTEDAQVGDSFASVALFIEEGTDADLAMVCTNDDGSDVIGTHDLNFTTFSGGAVAHALGGAAHTADTLANLNSKISGGKNVAAKEDANSWSERQTFNSGGVADAPIVVSPMAADPTTPTEGEVWTLTGGATKARVNGVTKRLDENIATQMHKVTAGEVTAGYLTLAASPVNAQSVRAAIVGGIQQVNKQVVGATGVTPDYDVLSTNQLHINNAGAATGLSGDIVEDDVLMIAYQI